MTLTDRIRDHVCADDAESMLFSYLDRTTFSGAWFETLGGPGDDPEVANRFTPADLVAVSTLSVRVSGWAAINLLEAKAAELNALLEAIPTNRALHEATDDDLEAVYAAQNALDSIDSIGHVTRSKLLARKRTHLVPIRDQHVLLALLDRDHGPFIQPLRDAFATDDELVNQLLELRQGRTQLSLLRVLDHHRLDESARLSQRRLRRPYKDRPIGLTLPAPPLGLPCSQGRHPGAAGSECYSSWTGSAWLMSWSSCSFETCSPSIS